VPSSAPVFAVGALGDPPPPLFLPGETWEALLRLCVLAVGGYAGSLVRLGLQYVKTTDTPSVLFAQAFGSFILGVVKCWRPAWGAASAARIDRLLYVFVASGLCGSITTFSTANAESHRALFLQLDDGYSEAFNNYSGARVADWLMALGIGFCVPLCALLVGVHLGEAIQHLGSKRGEPWCGGWLTFCCGCGCARARGAAAEGKGAAAAKAAGLPDASPWLTATPSLCLSRRMRALAELGVLGCFCIATVVILAATYVAGWGWVGLTCIMGAAGASLRWWLSLYNRANAFPRGTFAANLLGNVVLAIATVLSHNFFSYHDFEAQSMMAALSFGFCGCLTTMSTFVLEVHVLPRSLSYYYAIVSYAVCQLSWIVLYDAYSATLPPASTKPVPLDLCNNYVRLCGLLLDAVQCPATARRVGGCSVAGAVATFGALCACTDSVGGYGGYDASGRVSELLIDSQLPRALVAAAEVRVWPTVVSAVDDPLSVIDVCLTYENSCDALLTRVNCPVELRALNACDRRGLSAFVGQCRCGAVSEGDVRVLELIIDETLNRRYDLQPFTDYPDNAPIDLCGGYAEACSAWLDHVQCPPSQRVNAACAPGAAPFAYDKFVGSCGCFGNAQFASVSSARVSEALLDVLTFPIDVWPLLVPASGAAGPAFAIDGCASYAAACSRVLEAIGCPAALRAVQACGAGNGANQSMATFVGTCSCGAFTTPSRRVSQYLTDSLLAREVGYLAYAPPSVGAFALIATSDPFKQLRAPRYNPPKRR